MFSIVMVQFADLGLRVEVADHIGLRHGSGSRVEWDRHDRAMPGIDSVRRDGRSCFLDSDNVDFADSVT